MSEFSHPCHIEACDSIIVNKRFGNLPKNEVFHHPNTLVASNPTRPMFDHFGLLAPYYDRLIPPPNPQDLCELADLPVAGALLDAGGGTGRIASLLADQATQLVIADLSFRMLQRAAAKDHLEAVCTPSEYLPFPDAYFARVLMVDALHHVIDQQKSVSEMWRVLAPGGRLLIGEPDIGSLPVKIVAALEKLLLMRSHFLPPPQIVELFHYPDAQVDIQKRGYTAWIVAEKNL
jgi:demethylmenaquinone methyltransferase/2-methoxy-6-polyprenyl-1,4-benzoquinol methylase